METKKATKGKRKEEGQRRKGSGGRGRTSDHGGCTRDLTISGRRTNQDKRTLLAALLADSPSYGSIP